MKTYIDVSLIALLSVSMAAHAEMVISNDGTTITPFNLESIKNGTRANEQVALPHKGLQFVALKNMAIPEEDKNEIAIRSTEQKKKGFYETDSQYAKFLLGLPAHAASEIKEYKATHNPEDTHLKANLSDIKLVFPYKNITSIDKDNIIGYAAIGGWRNGWTGFKVFFTQKNKTICSYSYLNLKASNGDASQVNSDYATKDVNGKITYVDIEGDAKGILYGVNWFEADATAVHDLQCASSNFDKAITDETVTIAKKIDKDMAF